MQACATVLSFLPWELSGVPFGIVLAGVSRPRSEVSIDVAEVLRPRLAKRVAAMDGEVVESDDKSEVHG